MSNQDNAYDVGSCPNEKKNGENSTDKSSKT